MIPVFLVSYTDKIKAYKTLYTLRFKLRLSGNSLMRQYGSSYAPWLQLRCSYRLQIMGTRETKSNFAKEVK